ncbi:hypothetical protein [Radiobacillus sp. PE A8.2]|uniref:hypothetical protein n=1 Tax=Radiobacillus sp. PE A8.2 TaxID=3380349 RepID=UPI0038904EAF
MQDFWDEEICPEHGVITYAAGKVKCSVHFVKEQPDDGEENSDGVFLFVGNELGD